MGETRCSNSSSGRRSALAKYARRPKPHAGDSRHLCSENSSALQHTHVRATISTKHLVPSYTRLPVLLGYVIEAARAAPVLLTCQARSEIQHMADSAQR